MYQIPRKSYAKLRNVLSDLNVSLGTGAKLFIYFGLIKILSAQNILNTYIFLYTLNNLL